MYRFPLLALAILALLFGIWAGLLRMGWVWPPVHPALAAAPPILAAAHGPLMVSAFLGTVISLERAVALGRRWAYVVPALSALGGLLLITGLSWTWGGRLLALASAGLVVLFALIVRRHAAIYTWAMAAGSAAWLAGNVLMLLGRPLHVVAPWWVAFLVLTIAGERLELSRVLRPPPRTVALFAAAAGLFVGGVVLSSVNYNIGVRLAGAGMAGLAAWLLFYDIARRNLRRTPRNHGLTRFIAWCLFSGYLWLGAGGLLWLVYGGVPAGPIYDAILHSVFLGFVFAMIFGHAPLIFPSILRRPMAYLPAFYLPLIALHLSLILRVIGDLFNVIPLRQWGGLFNGVTLLLFLGITAAAMIKGSYE
jgi:hypothetical protein